MVFPGDEIIRSIEPDGRTWTDYAAVWKNDGSDGYELWRSDGTAAGTTMVKDLNAVAASGSVRDSLTNVNGTLFFSANDGSSGRELWRSDGTAAGTAPVLPFPFFAYICDK